MSWRSPPFQLIDNFKIRIEIFRPEDGTDIIDDTKLGIPHTLHLSGIFVGNLSVLVRAQLHIDEKSGCILKIAVRSPEQEISQLVADCIK